MRILFVCKYNRFRSRVAKAYFNKIKRDKKIKAESAGIIKGQYPLSSVQVKIAKEYGLNINGRPKSLNVNQLNSADKIIVVADDIPKIIFNYSKFKDKLIIWRIGDEWNGNIKNNRRIIGQIIKNVERLVKELKKNEN